MVTLRIKELLNERGLSTYALAKGIDMSQTATWNIVNGRTRKIDLDVIDRITDFLNCEPGELFKKSKSARQKGK